MTRAVARWCPSVFSPEWPRTSLVAAVTLLALASAQAQPSAAGAAPATPYVDKVMAEGNFDDSALQLKASAYNSSGPPRSLRLNYSIFSQAGEADATLSRALDLSAFVDTADYGSLSVNATLSSQDTNSAYNGRRATNGSWRLDQRTLPLDGGWRANHSAGDINTGNSALARGSARTYLPGTPVRGVGGEWYLGDLITLNASAGRTGLFNGVDLSGFEVSPGRIATAGGQFRLPDSLAGGRTDAAAQWLDARGISDYSGSASLQDTQAVWTSVGWEGAAPWNAALAPGSAAPADRLGGLRVQGNLLRSNSSRNGQALGLWADAAWRTERWRHTAGAFRFEPGLRWGAATIASDLQGVYWQADTSSRQWQAGFSGELSDGVSNAGTGQGRSAFASANGRYSLDTRNSVGAVLNVRALGGNGRALLLNWDRTGAWGQTQWRADLAHSAGLHTTRLGVDQNWALQTGTLSTSLAWERSTGASTSGRSLVWGVLGSVSPWPQWTLDVSMRGAHRSGGASSLNANLGARWQWDSGWSVGFRYTEARGKEPLSPLVVSALTAATLSSTMTLPTYRSVQLLLRYEGRAGTASAPLGGAAGSGAGTLSGTVFFDADASGRREASEAGVPGITVILDKRFVTRTDAQGYYEFPAAAAGQHLVDISPDNIPLPWSPEFREPVNTTLQVRQRTTVDFAVRRNR